MKWEGCTALALVLFALGLVGCASEEVSGPDGPSEEACGIVACLVDESVDESFDPDSVMVDVEGGKADAVDRVQAKLAEVTADGELDVDDVRALFEAAGGKLSVGEAAAIRDALGEQTDYVVGDEALAEAYLLARVANIPNDEEVAELATGRSFGGTEIPQAVLDTVAMARLNGAVAYDVTETDEEGEGVWTHYPSISPDEGNMAFGYTEVTPQALLDDVNDVDVVYNAIVGQETVTSAWGQEYKQARYEERVGGTGNIAAHYDEVYHPDLYARGAHGQKWASNVAILSDGTMHCLPAARRDVNQRLILTNPALARGKHLLYNGHITAIEGRITSIELSGRLSKLAASGKVNFIDPIALLEAWGFEISDGLEVRYGNTSDGVPVRRDGVITAPEPALP